MNTPSVVAKLCKTCGYCIQFCPKKAIVFSTERNTKGHFYPVIDLNGCVGCGTCTLVCPEAAIDMLKGED